MSINYNLHEYRLANGSDYRARVKYRQTVNTVELLAMMHARHPHLSQAEMRVVFEALTETLLPLLLDGNRVVTPMGTYGITIKGGFDAVTDRYVEGRNCFEMTIKPNPEMQEAFARQARPHKVEPAKPTPMLHEYVNVADPSAHDRLLPGNMARLLGDKLKVNPNDPEQGIFLLAMKNGRRDVDQPPIRINQLGINTDKELLFLVPPDLPPGAYRVEVRARFGKDLRSGQLRDILTVA